MLCASSKTDVSHVTSDGEQKENEDATKKVVILGPNPQQFDTDGVPIEVEHGRPSNANDESWMYFSKLAIPRRKTHNTAKLFTHSRLFSLSAEGQKFMAVAQNEGHSAQQVAKVMKHTFETRFGLDMDIYARYMMSDTTPSARNIASHFDAAQEECDMHLFNMCIGYALGLKDNIVTKQVWDPDTSSLTKTQVVVTPGGALPEGEVILRNGDSLKEPHKVQEVFNLPKLGGLKDVDVRVASACTLMRRSLFNYEAMKIYFSSYKIYVSRLALVETQRETTVTSSINGGMYFKRGGFPRMSRIRPSSRTSTEKNHRRTRVRVEEFLPAGKRCLSRLKGQLERRFPSLTAETVLALLLDPRCTCNIDKVLEAGDDTQSQHHHEIKKAALYLFRLEHRAIFLKIHKSNSSSEAASATEQPAAISQAQSQSTVYTDPLSAIRKRSGVAVPMATESVFSDVQKSKTDVEFDRWFELDPEWDAVAVAQLSKSEQGGVPANLLQLNQLREEYARKMTYIADDGSRN
ncbi:hypothetical protein PHMEG_00019932 [Phytophthora megakarya]|uniref:Uncharacterized protein n=1 Tax=Phytophthora megakarya TaxID=4795 RepID=A0A225VT02_9STRA|nr:hypothetical protein PHMEG_00019932 [Phytophthora megakarya]